MGYNYPMPKGIYLHKLKPPSRKGIHLTVAQKLHLSEIARARGFGKWMLGRKDSGNTKQLKRQNHARYWLGKKRPLASLATRKKMSITRKGRKAAQGTIDAVRLVNKGKFGKEHPG